MTGAPIGLLGARRDGRTGKVWAFENLVGVDPVVTHSSHWRHPGFQSMSRSEWHIVHVVLPDRVDEREEGGGQKGRGGFQACWGRTHAQVSACLC